jgi:predicted phage baseplate assembly protein
MPLSDLVPHLDDRRFGDISEEMRARIARYAPEWKPEAVWSDFNVSDPGIILAQTFAWLGEMLLFRMNNVPELNYVKFLELLGVELREAQPASVEVTLPVAPGWPTPVVEVPARMQVSAAVDGQPPVVFETERPLHALTAALQSVQVIDAGGALDRTAVNQQANSAFLTFGALAAPETALVLGFGYEAGYPTPEEFPQMTLDLAAWSSSRAIGRSQVTCSFPTRTRMAPARLAWEYWDGAEWQTLRALRDETLSFSVSGHILLRTPPVGSMKRDYLGAYDNDGVRARLFWIRARIIDSQYERVPELIALRTNTVAALQAETIQSEVLGGSDGRPNQRWLFSQRPVIAGSVRISVDDGTGVRPWTMVPDLLGSGPTDAHLAVNYSSGEVQAGDGENGDIPVANADNPDANVVAVSYRHGGGVRGNVAARSISSLLGAVPGLDPGTVTNLFPAAGGRDEESLLAAKKRAQLTIRARTRAVTADDFEVFATEAANIKRAKALALRHPQFPGVPVPGAVTVIVVPDADVSNPSPSPNEATLRAVCAYLDQRRLLTTEVFVVAPVYQTVTVDVRVLAKDDADVVEVHDEVEKVLTCYFHPLLGGDDGMGWPFGETIRYSKVYQRVFGVRGVDAVESLVIRLDGVEQAECRDVPIREDALLASMPHQVEVDFSFAEGSGG